MKQTWVELYEGLRRLMAQMYPPSDFGPVNPPLEETENKSQEELTQYRQTIEKCKKQRKDGYNRVKAKVKEIRRGYKTAVDRSTRSGSGKIVVETF